VGAIVTGAFALDLAISQVLKQAAGGRAGGMATAGTKSDPHLVVVTVDGARGSQAQSVARLAFFLGSTEYLSQAAGDCTNLAIWRSPGLRLDQALQVKKNTRLGTTHDAWMDEASKLEWYKATKNYPHSPFAQHTPFIDPRDQQHFSNEGRRR
jgi:hypothetical protein